MYLKTHISNNNKDDDNDNESNSDNNNIIKYICLSFIKSQSNGLDIILISFEC